jgi:hypothetical protein
MEIIRSEFLKQKSVLASSEEITNGVPTNPELKPSEASVNELTLLLLHKIK